MRRSQVREEVDSADYDLIDGEIQIKTLKSSFFSFLTEGMIL